MPSPGRDSSVATQRWSCSPWCAQMNASPRQVSMTTPATTWKARKPCTACEMVAYSTNRIASSMMYEITPLLTVLTYHHVADPRPGYPFDPDIADATPEQFRRQLETIARHFTVIGIDELIASLDGAPLPRNAAMITFDDGYRSCRDTALP